MLHSDGYICISRDGMSMTVFVMVIESWWHDGIVRKWLSLSERQFLTFQIGRFVSVSLSDENSVRECWVSMSSVLATMDVFDEHWLYLYCYFCALFDSSYLGKSVVATVLQIHGNWKDTFSMALTWVPFFRGDVLKRSLLACILSRVENISLSLPQCPTEFCQECIWFHLVGIPVR